MRLRHGDDPRWAAPDWDDRAWEVLQARDGFSGGQLPGHAGIYWVRFRMARTGRVSPRPVMHAFLWPRDEPGSPINSLFLPAVFAYELYWDGRLLARSGVVGNSRETEVAGPLDHLIMIPPDLLGPGPHLIALRISSYHYNFPSPTFAPYLAFENYTARLVDETRQPLFPMIASGVAGLAAVVCGALYGFVDRRKTLLWCGALGIAVALFYLLIAWRWLHPDTYDWLAPRYQMIDGLMSLITLLLPWLLLEQFVVPGRRWWILTLLPAIVAAWAVPQYAWDKATWMCYAMLVFSLGVAGWAVWRRRLGARFVLAGVLIGLAGVRSHDRGFFGPLFMLAFGGTGLGVLTAVGAQVQADRRRAREAVLTTARLEVELLRKNLQPHFLLNTLTALSEVVEQNPPGAVRLINDLAEEFRSLSRMSGEKLIPLADELELCRAHLRVMSLRTETTWRLLTDPGVPQAMVPPALFLTLIENGFAHQRIKETVAEFTLRQEPLPSGGFRYVMVSPGRIQAESNRAPGGTGLRYVKARLEESFPGQWTFQDGWKEAGWQTVIEISQSI
jgi:hypothetical protein